MLPKMKTLRRSSRATSTCCTRHSVKAIAPSSSSSSSRRQNPSKRRRQSDVNKPSNGVDNDSIAGVAGRRRLHSRGLQRRHQSTFHLIFIFPAPVAKDSIAGVSSADINPHLTSFSFSQRRSPKETIAGVSSADIHSHFTCIFNFSYFHQFHILDNPHNQISIKIIPKFVQEGY